MSKPNQHNKTANRKAPAAKKSVHVTNEVYMNPKNPVPFENDQVFAAVGGTRYIPFLHPDDDFAKQLLEARLESATNNACIITKKDYCAGLGFQENAGQELPEEIIDWFGSCNVYGDSALGINRRIFEDFFTWGNTPIELVRFKVGGKSHFYVYVHNLLEWRLADPDSDGVAKSAIRSKLFRRQGIVTVEQLKNHKPIPIYRKTNNEKDNWLKDGDRERTIIWYRNPVSGFDNYGMPSNLASMIYQVLEYKAARYNLDNLDNNMVVGGLLALKGNLSQTEANRIGKKIVDSHTGDGKRGRVVVVASEQGIDGSEFNSFDTTRDGSFKESDEQWMQKIILANEWDATLAGLVSSSTLGKGSGFLTKIMELKLNTVIRPAQQDLMDKVWSIIFKEAEAWTQMPFSKYSFSIRNSIDISGLTDVDITPAVTVNEVREAKGLPKDDTGKGNMYLGELKNQQQNKGGEDVQP